MEIVLFLIILILLILILSNIKTQQYQSALHYKNLQEKLKHLQQEVASLKASDQVLPKSDVKTSDQKQVDAVKLEPEVIIPETLQKEEAPAKTIDLEEVAPVILDYKKPQNSFSEKEIKPTFWEKFKHQNPDLEKFIGENLINKFGILILVLGISFFVKYAIDKDWINEISRVGIGILAGSIVMGVAHKLRTNFKAFSSVLVAGAISIFYFTIGIAFHQYQLLSQTTAFVIMVFITAFGSLVSVAYNRAELAVLALIGGFSVPFMVSTGQGNYVVLFTYIFILNIGILAIAYFKKWVFLNLLAFIFTTLLFGGWVSAAYIKSELPYTGALSFAVLYYLMFSILAVLYHVRNQGKMQMVDYGLIVSNTFAFFGFGIFIIHHGMPDFKGLFTLVLAIFNLIYAFLLYRKFGLEKNTIYLLVGLTLTFVTLTIPIQFQGNTITLFWAAEAVLLLWMSQQSKIKTFTLGAVVVQCLALGSLIIDWIKQYSNYDAAFTIILNPVFVAGTVVLIAMIVGYLMLKKPIEFPKLLGLSYTNGQYQKLLLFFIIGVTYFIGMLEVSYQANQHFPVRASVVSYSVMYHFMFSAIGLFIIFKREIEAFKKFAFWIILINLLGYLFFYLSLPTKEFISNIVQNQDNISAFVNHYVILVAVAYFVYLLVKQHQAMQVPVFFKSNMVMWLFAAVVVYILSSEINIHTQRFFTTTMQTDLAIQYPDADVWTRTYQVRNQIKALNIQISKIGYPILWGILSFLFLIVGIKKQWKQVRIMALSLLGLTIVKLFLFDIKNASETGKIIAFILLGILILIISFVYQKIKKLVTDTSDSKNQSDENIS